MAIAVNGETRLNTTVRNDVCIVDSTGADTRVNDAGDIMLKKAGVVLTTCLLGTAGLYMNSTTSRTIAAFKANGDVGFYGNVLTAVNVTTTGLHAACGSNSILVNDTHTYIAGPTVVSGTLNCGALTATSGTNSVVVNATNTTITGPVVVSGSLDCGLLSASSLSTSSDITFTNPIQTNILCTKSLVLGQNDDINGSTY